MIWVNFATYVTSDLAISDSMTVLSLSSQMVDRSVTLKLSSDMTALIVSRKIESR